MQPQDARDAELFHKGDRIRKARELAGFDDVSSFASAAGIDRGALKRYEKTGTVPRRSTMIAIAWYTPVRLEWLETGHGPVFKDDDGGGASEWARRGSNPRPADYRVVGSPYNRITFADFPKSPERTAA
jgi:transcriptional regulator with XRE-family HTH domain